jgi:hypothetical protein
MPPDLLEKSARGESVVFPAFFNPKSVELPEGFYFATITNGGKVKEFWLLCIPSASK